MRQVGSRLLLVMLLVCAGSLFVVPAVAAAETRSGVTERALIDWTNRMLVPIHSKKCVEVPHFSKRLGMRLQQWGCNGGSNQRWDIYDVGRDAEGYSLVKIRNRHSRLCANVKGGSLASGAPVVQWDCRGNAANTKWRLRIDGGAVFQNHRSRMCLNVRRASHANGARLIQYPCVSTDWNATFRTP